MSLEDVPRVTEILLAAALAAFCGCAAPRDVPRYTYRIVRTFPHDTTAFTQGLLYQDGFLYEGTGIWEQSSIRKVKLETGEVVQRRDIPGQYFGEGITIWKDRLIELTWQNGKGLLYDLATFEPRGEFPYAGEGWGLTTDGKQLIMSDGTSQLRFLDPATLRETRRLPVTSGTEPVTYLNELEWVEGEIFANVWKTASIARIDPRTGRVTGWIDLDGLEPEQRRNAEAVLNGIAYDARGGRLFVTGKLWPKLYEIRLLPAARAN